MCFQLPLQKSVEVKDIVQSLSILFSSEQTTEMRGLMLSFLFFPPQYQTRIRTEPGVLENVNSRITYLTLFHQTLISEHRFVY